MKKRWTALLLVLAMLSALAVGALADEQKKDETAAGPRRPRRTRQAR